MNVDGYLGQLMSNHPHDQYQIAEHTGIHTDICLSGCMAEMSCILSHLVVL